MRSDKILRGSSDKWKVIEFCICHNISCLYIQNSKGMATIKKNKQWQLLPTKRTLTKINSTNAAHITPPALSQLFAG